jgi:hypothetical protein
VPEVEEGEQTPLNPEDQRQALQGVVDYTKLLITLATGTVVISATFLDKFYAGEDKGLLIAGWVLLGVSVFAGFLAHGHYISKLGRSNLAVKGGGMETSNLVQLGCVVFGVVLFTIFVLFNLTAQPLVKVGREQSGLTGRVATTALLCGPDAVNGCAGSVTFSVVGPDQQKPVALGEALFATDHPGIVIVKAPDLLPKSQQNKVIVDELKIHVKAAGRFGNTRNIDVAVPAREELNGG